MDVYILIEDWAMDGDYDSSYTVFSEMEDAQKEFGTRLEQEKKNGYLSRWKGRDDFEEEISDTGYECYEYGNYCKNHYALKIETQQMVLSEQVIQKTAAMELQGWITQ